MGPKNQTRVFCKKQILLTAKLPPQSHSFYTAYTDFIFATIVPKYNKNNYLYSIYILQHRTSNQEIAYAGACEQVTCKQHTTFCEGMSICDIHRGF